MAVLIAAFPSFLPVYDELASIEGEGCSCGIVFGELADLANQLLVSSRDEGQERTLENLFAAIEQVANAPGVDAHAVVGESFLDSLDDRARIRADPYLGPRTSAIAEHPTRDDDPVRDDDQSLSRAGPPPLRARPRRYSGRAPRRRRRL
ncbi:MAG TPA: hypothetical protein VKR27_04135 [Acidimicrobiales bacterium]|nr:hypothetical protein [Acidimicrobiales bacterium]